MADMDLIIEQAVSRNLALQQSATMAANAVMTAASGRITAPAGYVVPVPTLRSDPPAFNPNTDLSVDFREAYDRAFADFTPIVLESVLDFLARFFPASLATVCDDWIQSAIVDGGTGIPAAIENAIWERARAREVVEGVRLEQEAMNQFAARGFMLPPGVLAARVYEAQRDSVGKSSTINREVAIKAIDVEITNIRFAIEQGLKVRVTVISAVGDYIRAWMKPAEEAVKYAAGIVNAKERLWNEASRYYSAMIEEARLKLSAHEIMAVSRDKMVYADVDSFTKFVTGQTTAAMVVAQVTGQAAAGAMNALGISAGKSEQRVGPIE